MCMGGCIIYAVTFEFEDVHGCCADGVRVRARQLCAFDEIVRWRSAVGGIYTRRPAVESVDVCLL